jgi:cyclophilin family peptidyl-prolyl cis-trans isomerase
MDSNPKVVFETTKGNIVIELHPDWSPLGVEHFKKLVGQGFYDGAPWFRVIEGFVAQCGISANARLNEDHGERTIKDEPLKMGNLTGRVSFGRTGAPNSRSSHIFINYKDNSFLDSQGFPAFGQVVEGMDVAQALAKVEFEDQPTLASPAGMDIFREEFPQADYILKAYVQE